MLRATNSKLIAETAKLANEARWMPWVSMAVIIGAIVGVAKLLH